MKSGRWDENNNIRATMVRVEVNKCSGSKNLSSFGFKAANTVLEQIINQIKWNCADSMNLKKHYEIFVIK